MPWRIEFFEDDQGRQPAREWLHSLESGRRAGEILEDEKILGSAHVAFGASAGIGGTVQVPIHLDCIVLRPTVDLDGKAFVREGDLVVE